MQESYETFDGVLKQIEEANEEERLTMMDDLRPSIQSIQSLIQAKDLEMKNRAKQTCKAAESTIDLETLDEKITSKFLKYLGDSVSARV